MEPVGGRTAGVRATGTRATCSLAITHTSPPLASCHASCSSSPVTPTYRLQTKDEDSAVFPSSKIHTTVRNIDSLSQRRDLKHPSVPFMGPLLLGNVIAADLVAEHITCLRSLSISDILSQVPNCQGSARAESLPTDWNGGWRAGEGASTSLKLAG